MDSAMQRDGSNKEATSESEPEDVLARLFRSGRNNALISWVLVGILCLVFVESVFDGDRLWILFVAATATIVLIPPVSYWDWQMMLPWELLVVALLPILVHALFGGELGTFSYYLSVAALALLLTVEFHMFTTLQLTHWSAVMLVVLTTMASAAAWAVVRWNMDTLFGTSFLLTPETSQNTANELLMVEFVWVTLAGFAAGILFDAYFKRRGRYLRRHLRRVVRR